MHLRVNRRPILLSGNFLFCFVYHKLKIKTITKKKKNVERNKLQTFLYRHREKELFIFENSLLHSLTLLVDLYLVLWFLSFPFFFGLHPHPTDKHILLV